MPAFSTHYCFADGLKEQISRIDGRIKLNKPALYFGTQGPDIYFMHRILPTMRGRSLRPLGSLLHRSDPAVIFSAMGEYLKTQRCDCNIVKSYIYGFICHYALDSVTHPYIYALQKQLDEYYAFKKAPSFVTHNMIELSIDSLTLKRTLGIEKPSAFRTDTVLLCDERLINEISRLLAYAVPRICGETADAGQHRTALLDTIKIQRLLSDDRGIKYPVLSALQKPVSRFTGPAATAFFRPAIIDKKWDYLNEAKLPWIVPAHPETTSNLSFAELTDIARRFAVNMISGFDSAINGSISFDALTGNMSFDTGARFDVPVELH